ncbi:DMT family transporter [Devosia sp. CAU 1758]
MPVHNPRLALFLATGGLVCLIAMSAIIHEAAPHATLGQLIFWRSAIALPPIIAYLALRGQIGMSVRTRRPGKHLVRGVLGCVVMALNFTALAYLSVGVATTLSYLTPILSMFAAMLLLKERSSVLVVLGVAFGFVGVLIMLFPALVGSDVRDGALIGIAAGVGMAATNALSRVQVKDLTRTDPPASIALSFGLLSTFVGGVTFLFGWMPLDGQTQLLLVGAGLLGGIGHVIMMEAVARAPVSLLAGYEYTGILWAFFFDAVLLGVHLDAWNVTGAAVIVVAAILVAVGQGTFRRTISITAGSS